MKNPNHTMKAGHIANIICKQIILPLYSCHSSWENIFSEYF